MRGLGEERPVQGVYSRVQGGSCVGVGKGASESCKVHVKLGHAGGQGKSWGGGRKGNIRVLQDVLEAEVRRRPKQGAGWGSEVQHPRVQGEHPDADLPE